MGNRLHWKGGGVILFLDDLEHVPDKHVPGKKIGFLILTFFSTNFW